MYLQNDSGFKSAASINNVATKQDLLSGDLDWQIAAT
jgi:hypothetical protein